MHRMSSSMEQAQIIKCWTDGIELTKVYGIEKRSKLYTMNEWDCHPVSRRMINPNKASRLRERLYAIQKKAEAADKVVHLAGTVSELRKAVVDKHVWNITVLTHVR